MGRHAGVPSVGSQAPGEDAVHLVHHGGVGRARRDVLDPHHLGITKRYEIVMLNLKQYCIYYKISDTVINRSLYNHIREGGGVGGANHLGCIFSHVPRKNLASR